MASDPSPPALVLRADPLRAARQVVVAAQVSLTATAGRQVVVVEGAKRLGARARCSPRRPACTAVPGRGSGRAGADWDGGY